MRIAFLIISALMLLVHGDVGCAIDPHGCPGVVAAGGDGGPGMDPNG